MAEDRFGLLLTMVTPLGLTLTFEEREEIQTIYESIQSFGDFEDAYFELAEYIQDCVDYRAARN